MEFPSECCKFIIDNAEAVQEEFPVTQQGLDPVLRKKASVQLHFVRPVHSIAMANIALYLVPLLLLVASCSAVNVYVRLTVLTGSGLYDTKVTTRNVYIDACVTDTLMLIGE